MTVASPPANRSVTAEQSRTNVRTIQRRCSAKRRCTADRQPNTTQIAVAIASVAKLSPAMGPDVG